MSQVKFFDLLRELDGKIQRHPEDGLDDRFVELVGDTALNQYVFERLETADWIEPLWAAGFFKRPPNLERDETQGTVGFPPWPESGYLARMASKKPDIVRKIILQIPETDNISVHQDLTKAALAMPPHLSAALAKKEANWIKQQDHLFFVLPNTLEKLISHLALGGEVDTALDLASAVLEVLPDPKAKEKAQEDSTYSIPPQPTVRFDQWEYGEIIKENIPELVRAADVKAVKMLCDLLKTAIRYSQRDGEKGAPVDYSWIWRPAIENHAQNRHHGLKDLLVTSLRDACELLIREEKANVRDLVETLEDNKYPWHVFHRIALHLLRLFPESTGHLIAQKLTDCTLFDTHAFRHEYAMLLRDCFKLLSEKQQEVILGWIKEGPDLKKYKKTTEEVSGKRPTDEDAQFYKKYWQRDRLAWFKAVLPKQWAKYYENLVTEVGEPEHPEFASYSGTIWVGPTSPRSAEELQGMTVGDIVTFLKTWEPPEEHMAPSAEGLGRVLSSLVSEKPDQFSEEAAAFQGLDATYVRAMLSGFRDALNKGKTFNWLSVFNLCDWVIQQPRDVADEKHVDMDKDPHWGWARKVVADLLSAGFKESETSIPFEYRETVWKILQPLTEDPEPTPEYEAEYGGSNMDPSSLSINTTRGEAMHTVIRYALWVRRHFETEPEGKERLARGFDEMPEVCEVLETHLDTSVDPSLAIRAVYGQWFPWLVLLDSSWSKENANRIFPPEDKQRSFWDAVWNAYVTHCQAYDDVFEAIQDQYALAIERLSEPSDEADSYASPQERLGEHLMVFYWRGKLSLEEPSLLQRFWKKASPVVRGRALEFVGRSLQDTEGDVPAEIVKRLKQLWEMRLGEAKSAAETQNFLPEMKAFGWWFLSEKVDDGWALKQLLEAVNLSKKIDRSRLVVERLAAIAEQIPLEPVQCLEQLVKGDREGWKIHGWIDEAKTILSHAIKKGGKPGELAEDLIHYLGSRGYLQFRPLLNEELNAN